MLLSEAKEGKTAVVKKICAGKELVCRLAELGIYEGGKISIVKNGFGPVVLEVHGGLVSIGRGQAKKIEVE